MTQQPQAPQEAPFFTAIRGWQIYRGDHGLLGGVVEGLGDKVQMPRVPARILYVLLTLVSSGLGFLVYALGWALLPDRKGNIVIQNFGRGVINAGALIGVAIFGLLGLTSLFNGPWMSIGRWGAWDGGSGPNGWLIALGMIAIVAVVATIVVVIGRNRQDREKFGMAATPATPPPAAPPSNATATAPAAAGTAVAVAGATTAMAQTPPPAPPSAPAQATPAQATPAAPAQPSVPAVNQAPIAVAPAPRPQPEPRQYAAMPGTVDVPGAAPRTVRQTPRVMGPGRAWYLIALAVPLLLWAFALIADRQDWFEVRTGIVYLTGFVLAFGALVIGIGLSGRRTGFIGFVAGSAAVLLALIVAVNPAMAAVFDKDYSWSQIPEQIAEDLSDGDQTFHLFGATITGNPQVVFDDYDVEAGSNVGCFDISAWSADDRVGATAEEIDITAGTLVLDEDETVVRVPEGTNLVLEPAGTGTSAVYFQDRQIACAAFDNVTGDSFLEMTADPDGPTVTITYTRTDQTVILEEVSR